MSQIRSGLKDRESLIRFLADPLGYVVTPIFWEARDLGIPPYIAKQVNNWWQLINHPGSIPFQVHLCEVAELTFYICCDVINSFIRRHPGNYLFVFTQDYCHMVFMTVERVLERRPFTWRREPKYYYRFLLTNCSNPTGNDVRVLSELRVDSSLIDSATIHNKIVTALKLSEHGNELPEWFMPWYFRLGYSQDRWERLQESGNI